MENAFYPAQHNNMLYPVKSFTAAISITRKKTQQESYILGPHSTNVVYIYREIESQRMYSSRIRKDFFLFLCDYTVILGGKVRYKKSNKKKKKTKLAGTCAFIFFKVCGLVLFILSESSHNLYKLRCVGFPSMVFKDIKIK